MPITQRPDGRFYFQFDRRIAGGRQRANKLLPKGWTRTQARAYDVAESARLYALATGAAEPTPALIDDAVLLYLTHHAPALKNARDIEGALALLHPWYAGRPLADLPAIARQFAADQAGTLAAGTIRNRLAYLRSACRWAWKHHALGDTDPAARMHLPPVRNARKFFFDRTTMLQVARQIRNPASRAAFRVAFYSGLRAGEVLRAQGVTLGTTLGLLITDSKNNDPHFVPAHPRIAHLVRHPDRWQRVTTWTISKHFKAAARAIGLGHLRLHDTRHSAASEIINHGGDLHTVGAVLNHKSATSTRRYAHLAKARLLEAVRMIGQRQPANPNKTTGHVARNSHTHPTAKAA